MSEGLPRDERLPYAKSFFELVVYRKARALAGAVFTVTQRFPKDESFSLTDQWRRSARSIGGQIAEAWAKRRYPRHFISKLTDADSEQLETQHWTAIAHDCGYLSPNEERHLSHLAQEIGRMLGAMITNAEKFCAETIPANLHDDPTPYFLPPHQSLITENGQTPPDP